MKIEEIKKVVTPVLIKHQVKRAGLFGSAARQETTKDSDIDILVELREGMSLLDFIEIKLDLEEALHQAVDLVEYKAIKPILMENILSEEVKLYG